MLGSNRVKGSLCASDVASPPVCDKPVRLALQCVHGDQRRLEVGCGSRFDRECVPCANRWRKRIRRRLLVGSRLGGNYYFLTLTMPGRAVVGAGGIADAKQAWRTFSKRWRQRFGPRAAYYLVAEFQRRGVLHFHVVLRMPNRLPILRPRRIAVRSSLVSHRRRRAWYRSTSWWSTAIRQSGFGEVWEIEPVRSVKGVASYLGSYLTKAGDFVGYRIIKEYGEPLRLHHSSRNWLLAGDRPARPYGVWFLMGAGNQVQNLPAYYRLLEFQTRLTCVCREAANLGTTARRKIRRRIHSRWLTQTDYPIPKGITDEYARGKTHGGPEHQR